MKLSASIQTISMKAECGAVGVRVDFETGPFHLLYVLPIAPAHRAIVRAVVQQVGHTG